MRLQKKDVWKFIKKKRESSKAVSKYESKKEVSEQFGRKKSQDVGGNRNFLWKEMGMVNGRKVESWSRIKNGNGKMRVGEDEL